MIEMKITVEQTATEPTELNPKGLDFVLKTNYGSNGIQTDLESALMAALAYEIEQYIGKCRAAILEAGKPNSLMIN